MKVFVQIFGVLLTLAAGCGVLFFATLAGLSYGPKPLDFLVMAMTSLGFFGSLIILGVHCTFLRWINSEHIDQYSVCLMYILVVVATLLLIFFAGSGNMRDIGPYFAAFIFTAFICHIGIMAGRK